jgi:hypothetical protein
LITAHGFLLGYGELVIRDSGNLFACLSAFSTSSLVPVDDRCNPTFYRKKEHKDSHCENSLHDMPGRSVFGKGMAAEVDQQSVACLKMQLVEFFLTLTLRQPR